MTGKRVGSGALFGFFQKGELTRHFGRAIVHHVAVFSGMRSNRSDS